MTDDYQYSPTQPPQPTWNPAPEPGENWAGPTQAVRIYNCRRPNTHTWSCRHETTCECGQVTRILAPEGM